MGCSIDISRDIYMDVGMSVCLWETHTKKDICQNTWAELHGPNTRMLKVSFGRLKLTLTPVLFISTIR